MEPFRRKQTIIMPQMNAIHMTMGCSLLLFTCGCDRVGIGPGLYDFHYDVAKGYILARTSAHKVQIHPNAAFSPTDPQIPPKVIEVGWNERFILAKQYPLKRRSPNNPNDTYELPDKSHTNYWILDANGPAVYGPFDKAEFEKKRLALGVPSELILKPVKR